MFTVKGSLKGVNYLGYHVDRGKSTGVRPGVVKAVIVRFNKVLKVPNKVLLTYRIRLSTV